MKKSTALSCHFPHQGLNGGWQSDDDYLERRRMIFKIVEMLRQRKPNAPQAWLDRLPSVAKRLEVSLYRSARSFDEYSDESTLKRRLQQLAINVGVSVDKKKLRQQQKQEERRRLAILQQEKFQAAARAATQHHHQSEEGEDYKQDHKEDGAAAADAASVLEQRLGRLVFRPIERPENEEEMRQEEYEDERPFSNPHHSSTGSISAHRGHQHHHHHAWLDEATRSF